MTAVGGSIESITLAGRNFSVPTDTETTRKIGGFENEVQANGDGTARLIKSRVPFMVDGLNVAVDDFKQDHEFLRDLSERKDFFPITVSFASGAIWQGDGQIVGELAFNSQNTAASFGLAGTGLLTQQ